jgi:hypothetical protein
MLECGGAAWKAWGLGSSRLPISLFSSDGDDSKVAAIGEATVARRVTEREGQPGRLIGLGCSPFPPPPRGARWLNLTAVVVGACTAAAAARDGGRRQPGRPEGPQLLPSPSSSGGGDGPNSSCVRRRCGNVMEVARMGGGARGAPGRPRASAAPPSPTSIRGYVVAVR